jgi:hypothetical protein
MAAQGIFTVVTRMIFIENHVGHKTTPGIAAFDKIVAKNHIFREISLQCMAKCINIINPLANKRTLVK